MKRILFILIVTIQSISAIIGQIKTTFPNQESIKNQMDEAMKTNDLPAVVVMAVNRNNQKSSYTYGKAVWTKNTAVTTNHIFSIWSMTKLVTSIAAMQMVEKGLIGLDDDLTLLLPEMSQIPILSNGQLIQAKKPITLRHLLTHTSGFGYDLLDQELKNFDRSNWAYKESPRRFESGTQFLYGPNTTWAGKLVEKLSKMTLENYFRKNITGPLGMNRTWFNVPDSLKQFIVSTGTRGADGQQPLTESPNRIPSNTVTDFHGDGGLYSSPEDYTLLLQCMVNFGKLNNIRILKKKTILEMNKNQIGNISLANAGASLNQTLWIAENSVFPSNSKWGLAYLIDNNEKPYGRKAGTVLWGGLMNTYFYIDYKSGIAASIYTQHFPFNHPATTGLFDKFSEIIYSGR